MLRLMMVDVFLRKNAMIRELSVDDLTDIEEVFFNSFSSEEAPVTYPVIKSLIIENSNEDSYCIGHQSQGKIVGAVGFSRVFFEENTPITAYILAPLATHKHHQKRGIATQLIEKAKSYFKQSGVDALLVYGDPAYYGRYGFDANLGKHFIPPYPLEYDFGWQALMLSDADIENSKLHFKCVKALSDASLW
jgi:putative acetyltransferase